MNLFNLQGTNPAVTSNQPSGQTPREMNRRAALKTTATLAAGLFNIPLLFAAEDPHKAILEKTIKAAQEKGLKKLPYDFYRQHPSPLFADVTLRLVMRKLLSEGDANRALNRNAESIHLKESSEERFKTITFDTAFLVHGIWRDEYKKNITGILNAMSLCDKNPQEAREQLITGLKEKDVGLQ